MTILIYGLGIYVALTFVASVIGSFWGITDDPNEDE